MDFPTPPFPELTATTCSTSGRRLDLGVGAGTLPGRSPPRGGVAGRAVAALGSLTLTFTSETPSTPCATCLTSRTRSPGSSTIVRTVSHSAPSDVVNRMKCSVTTARSL